MARKASRADAGKDSSDAGTGARKRSGQTSTPRRTRRAATRSPERVRLCWAVVSSSMRQVAIYDYAARDQADRRARELSEQQKSPHFVLAVRVPLPAGNPR